MGERRRSIILSVALLVALSSLVGTATAARGVPEYRDPPSFDGLRKPPKTKPAPLPAAVELSQNGSFPNLLVDEAGTAHITWADARGDDSDAAVYCRLQRGASACDTTTVLTWTKPYGTGDGPQFNNDYLGPRIVRVGDQLVIFSKRYPTVADKPTGASSSTVIAWTSSDGGNTWTDAQVIGRWDLGQMTVIGPDDQPRILNLGYDAFCGGMCLSVYESGVFSTNTTVLNTDPNSNYDPTLVSDGASALAGFDDLSPRSWLRRWDGTGPITDPASWSVSPPIPGSEPELASGPLGPFLLNRDGLSGPYRVRQLTTQADNTVTGGDPVTISSEQGAQFARLIEDPSGRLSAAWQQSGTGVVLRRSTSGAGGFGSEQRLIDGDLNGQIELDATTDGGGFAVLNHTGGINSVGQLVAIGVGKTTPTGLPGIADLPGGGAPNVSGQQVNFGAFVIDTAEGVFLNGTGANKGVVVTRGEVTLNGLRIIPDPGSVLVINPTKLTIDTIGQARAVVSNGTAEVTLFHGEIDRDLKGLQPGSRLFEFPVTEFQANVLGFDVAADIPVLMRDDGVEIPIDIELPPQFGGFTGHAKLVATRGEGLVLDSLNIHIGPVPLGALTIESIDLDWRQDSTWRGSGKLSFINGGALDASVEFEGGDFNGADFNYDVPPPNAIGPFVYLLSVGGGFFLDPVTIIARAALGAGAAFQGEAPVKVDGQFTMKFPSGGPASFLLDGAVELFFVHVADGFLRFITNGYADFGGNARLDVGPIHGSAEVEGFVDGPTGKFGADLQGDLGACVTIPNPFDDDFPLCGEVGADAAVSNVGFAACAEIEVPDFIPISSPITGGLAVRWEDINPFVLYSPFVLTAQLIDAISVPCHTTEYKAPPPQPAPRSVRRAGGQVIAIEGGLPTATILVKAGAGVPSVSATGPNGETVSAANPSQAGFIVEIEGADAQWLVLTKPAAGNWTITPDEGSPEISEVLVANGLPEAAVKGDVEKGRIEYRTKHLAGRQVTFREEGRFGTHLLGTVDDSRGTFKFKPAPGPGGKRRVIAQVERDGLIMDQVPLGSYTAPGPPKPGKVRGLRAKRRGSSLEVSFKTPAHSDRTEVTLKGSGGIRMAQVALGKQRRVTFDALKWAKRLKVRARGVSEQGVGGPASRLTVR